MEMKIIIKTDKDMQLLGEQIGKNAFPNMVITMEGDLGAGKTTMTKGIGRALGVKEIINSPTFTIMKVHEGTMPLYHMDVYRINNDSGDDYLEEYFECGGVTVIEWANNVSDFIPEERLEINIEINDKFERVVSIIANTPEYIKVLEGLNI